MRAKAGQYGRASASEARWISHAAKGDYFRGCALRIPGLWARVVVQQRSTVCHVSGS